MSIRIARGGVVDGDGPRLPPSKSHAQRALVLGALLPDAPRVEGLGDGAVTLPRDILVMQRAVLGIAGGESRVDVQDNGTALRILAVVVAMLGRQCGIVGTERLRRRPMGAVVEFLERYGARCTAGWPGGAFAVDGEGARWPDALEVDARLSTQPATGVLLGAALRLARDGRRHEVRVRAPAARGYVMVTLEVLGWFGFELDATAVSADLVVELRRYSPTERVTIPVDPSSRVFVDGYRAMHGLPLSPAVESLPHPDAGAMADIRRLLAARQGEAASIDGIERRPDSFPVLAALAALRPGPTTLRGAPALRHKESDRIAAMATALRALGAQIEEHPDGLTVTGPLPTHDHTVPVPTPDDHRIVMAVALLGTTLEHGIEIDNPEAVEKSWPDFFQWLPPMSE